MSFPATSMINPENYPKDFPLDYSLLDRMMDKLKAKVFIGKNSAFYGALMCSVNFVWAENIMTAQTSGLSISWNPYFFLALDEQSRVTVLLHELKHIANLHVIRRGNREWDTWNRATDYVVNGELYQDGYYMDGFPYIMDPIRFAGMGAEEIYDILINENQGANNAPMPDWLRDLFEEMSIDPHTIINTVVAAHTAAEMAGQGEGNIEQMLKRFLQPKLPWTSLLYRWFNEKSVQDYSWRKPNRRYSDMYLPSLVEDDTGGLDHIIQFQDVSGSIRDVDIIRFNSEAKYMKDTFNPKKMTLVQFDWAIRDITEILEHDDFDEIKITGRGGTNLVPVREMIINENPTAAIIFTDLLVTPMEPLPPSCRTEILWVVASTGKVGPFGETINIRE